MVLSKPQILKNFTEKELNNAHNFRSMQRHTHHHTRTLPHNVLIASLVGALLQTGSSKWAQQAIVNLTQALIENVLALFEMCVIMSNTTTHFGGSLVKQ